MTTQRRPAIRAQRADAQFREIAARLVVAQVVAAAVQAAGHLAQVRGIVARGDGRIDAVVARTVRWYSANVGSSYGSSRRVPTSSKPVQLQRSGRRCQASSGTAAAAFFFTSTDAAANADKGKSMNTMFSRYKGRPMATSLAAPLILAQSHPADTRTAFAGPARAATACAGTEQQRHQRAHGGRRSKASLCGRRAPGSRPAAWASQASLASAA